MIALGIIILILVLILLMPVGVDAAYSGRLSLRVKAGPFSIAVLPSKSGEGKKDKKDKKDKKHPKPQPKEEEKKKTKKAKLKLSFEDIMTILRIGLRTLGRFFRSISVDLLKLHFLSAGPDPYSAVMNYGRFNAAISALLPFVYRVCKIKKEDYASSIDFESDKQKIDARIILTIRIGQILLVVLCAAFAFIKWFLRFRRRNKAEAKTGKVTENSSAEKGN